ncbi:hypothetical protein DVH05_025245 [Phytophthora capsici]|nr:hypothetical protein DVH05_025245 [Phytophthora capsici]
MADPEEAGDEAPGVLAIGVKAAVEERGEAAAKAPNQVVVVALEGATQGEDPKDHHSRRTLQV